MKFKVYVKALDEKHDCFSVEVEASTWGELEEQMEKFLSDGEFKGHQWSIFPQIKEEVK
jgi:hypothetical protein